MLLASALTSKRYLPFIFVVRKKEKTLGGQSFLKFINIKPYEKGYSPPPPFLFRK